MYIAKVYLDRKLMNVRLYEDYEHFLSDLISGGDGFYDCLPEDKAAETKFDRPKLFSCGNDSLGFGGDFEYRYSSGITVYCGTALTAEELAGGLDMTSKEYLDAVDRVCIECAFGEGTCLTCPVRLTNLATKRPGKRK